jgi:hypothetical protein
MILLARLLAIIALAIVPTITQAGWYLIPGISKHVNTTTEHNEYNYGIGIEEEWRSRNWQIGIYKNSYWKTSTYVMAELTSFRFSDTMRFRLNGGLVTGYRYAITPMVLPVWTYEGEKYGFDALTIPAVAGRMGIYAVQLRVRF